MGNCCCRKPPKRPKRRVPNATGNPGASSKDSRSCATSTEGQGQKRGPQQTPTVSATVSKNSTTIRSTRYPESNHSSRWNAESNYSSRWNPESNHSSRWNPESNHSSRWNPESNHSSRWNPESNHSSRWNRSRYPYTSNIMGSSLTGQRAYNRPPRRPIYPSIPNCDHHRHI